MQCICEQVTASQKERKSGGISSPKLARIESESLVIQKILGDRIVIRDKIHAAIDTSGVRQKRQKDQLNERRENGHVNSPYSMLPGMSGTVSSQWGRNSCTCRRNGRGLCQATGCSSSTLDS